MLSVNVASVIMLGMVYTSNITSKSVSAETELGQLSLKIAKHCCRWSGHSYKRTFVYAPMSLCFGLDF